MHTRIQSILNLPKREQILSVIFFSIFIAGILVTSVFTPPRLFVSETVVDIPEGVGLSEVARILKQNKVISSEFFFKALIVLQGGTRSIVAGGYYFDHPEGLANVSSRLAQGISGLELVKITIPEGQTNSQIAETFASRFHLFDKEYFLSRAPQGYLFPDTYSFYQNVSAKGVLGRMQDVFNTKTASLKAEAESQHKSFANAVVIASLLEEEVQTIEDKKLVSGIIQNRLKIDMALQIDSASTTYRERGLPRTPISNPGLESIEAALNPTQSDFLYYLSDLKGHIYYAKTFDGHQTNREKYLNK